MKTPRFKSIRFRLTLWYALVLVVVFLVSDILLYKRFRKSQLDTIDSTLYWAAEEVESAIAGVPYEKWKENIRRVERSFIVNRLFIQLLEFPEKKEENLLLISRSGILAGNISLKDLWDMISSRFPEKPIYLDVNINEVHPVAHPMRFILYPLLRPGNKKYLVQVGISLKKMFTTLKSFLIILLVSAPLLLVVSVVGGYFILTEALRPVQTVVRTARKITTEDLSHRIDPKNRKDEIGQLITTFNQMISRLERSVQQLKQFSSDASHDLKTPLTVIRGEIDIALRKERTPKEYKKTLVSVQEEAKKLEGVIENLMFLSRIDARDGNSQMQPVPLDETLLNVYEKTALLANKKGIYYLIDEIDSASIMGDGILLNRLFMNVLDNAIKYTPAGGKVKIALATGNGHALFTVSDTGVGIPAESLPYIFDRFYRVDESRTQRPEGSGLGLSIVKKIADIHHAQVEVQSVLHQGTTVRIAFPLIS